MVGPIQVLGRERLRAAGAILNAEADSLKLKRQLGAEFTALALPVIEEQKGLARNIPSKQVQAVSIREAITRTLAVRTRYTGMSVGIAIRAGVTDSTRNFRYAPRRFNARAGFRHPNFGHDPWQTQIGGPGWFDKPPVEHREEFLSAALLAVERMEARIVARMAAIP